MLTAKTIKEIAQTTTRLNSVYEAGDLEYLEVVFTDFHENDVYVCFSKRSDRDLMELLAIEGCQKDVILGNEIRKTFENLDAVYDMIYRQIDGKIVIRFW